MVLAPLIAPVFDIPSLLLSMPPVTASPPLVMMAPPVNDEGPVVALMEAAKSAPAEGVEN
jgi:hypothetical protein